jgi:pyruvate,water dikinase
MAEFLPEPATPLFGTLGIETANSATFELMNWFFGPRIAMSGFSYVTINGYVYAGMRLGLRELLPYIWFSVVASRRIFSTGVERWRNEAIPRYEAATHRWRERDVGGASDAALMEGVRQILAAAMHYYTVIQSGTIPSASSSELTFTRFYRHLVMRKEDPDPTVFLLGFDSAPILAEKALFDLGTWAIESPDLRTYLLQADSREICAAIDGTGVPIGLPEALWQAFRERFRAYLASHGNTAYDLDFAKPVPSESPEPVVETLKLCLRGEAPDPYERQRRAVERRETETAAIMERLDPIRRRLFAKLLKWAQRSAPLREDSIAGLGYGYGELRRLLFELGRRLAIGGSLDSPEDIFWLTEDELDSALQSKTQDEEPADLQETINRRKASWQAARRATPPNVLPKTSKLARLMPSDATVDGGSVLKGIGSGEGKVTARACVLHGPEEFGQLRPGDILVAVTTTPAWTPLFAMASAVVTDIGGPLSHSSIVAREYGIPAVMGVAVATRRIQTGQVVTVDGSTGEVHLPRDSEVEG